MGNIHAAARNIRGAATRNIRGATARKYCGERSAAGSAGPRRGNDHKHADRGAQAGNSVAEHGAHRAGTCSSRGHAGTSPGGNSRSAHSPTDGAGA